MADDTKIEWADDTVNPWWGCTKVSPACSNCYAESWDARWAKGEAHWGPTAPRKLRVERAILDLQRIARRSDKEGRPRRVFIASMSDFFEDRPDLVEPRKSIWEVLHELAGDSPRITPLLLTKRPDVMAAWADEHGWPGGAWAGTTVEDQRRADERIPHLLRVPARVRFLSCEPLLEPVDLGRAICRTCHGQGWVDSLAGRHGCETCGEVGAWGDPADGIGWVIVGGESGPGARPMHPAWARSLRDQCQEAGVAFHFKQWGAWVEVDPSEGREGDWWSLPAPLGLVPFIEGDGQWYQAPLMRRVGKKAAGRLLDGREWSEVSDAR